MVVPPIVSDSIFANSNLFDGSVNAGVIKTCSMTAPRPRRFRLTIRALLFVTAIAAIAATVWINRPRDTVLVKVDDSGTIFVDDTAVRKGALTKLLTSKQRWFATWGKEMEVVIAAVGSTPTTTITEIIENVDAAGVENVTLRVLDDTP